MDGGADEESREESTGAGEAMDAASSSRASRRRPSVAVGTAAHSSRRRSSRGGTGSKGAAGSTEGASAIGVGNSNIRDNGGDGGRRASWAGRSSLGSVMEETASGGGGEDDDESLGTIQTSSETTSSAPVVDHSSHHDRSNSGHDHSRASRHSGTNIGFAEQEFVEASSFIGIRPGFKFQIGPLGLGYYKDPYQAGATTDVDGRQQRRRRRLKSSSQGERGRRMRGADEGDGSSATTNGTRQRRHRFSLLQSSVSSQARTQEPIAATANTLAVATDAVSLIANDDRLSSQTPNQQSRVEAVADEKSDATKRLSFLKRRPSFFQTAVAAAVPTLKSLSPRSPLPPSPLDRLLDADQQLSSVVEEAFQPGDAVEALFQGRGQKYYPANVVRIHPGGTYDVLFRDGYREDRVLAQNLRRPSWDIFRAAESKAETQADAKAEAKTETEDKDEIKTASGIEAEAMAEEKAGTDHDIESGAVDSPHSKLQDETKLNGKLRRRSSFGGPIFPMNLSFLSPTPASAVVSAVSREGEDDTCSPKKAATISASRDSSSGGSNSFSNHASSADATRLPTSDQDQCLPEGHASLDCNYSDGSSDSDYFTESSSDYSDTVFFNSYPACRYCFLKTINVFFKPTNHIDLAFLFLPSTNVVNPGNTGKRS